MIATAAGIDTWSPCWRVGEDSPTARAMRSLANVPAARSRLIEESIGGHRVGWFPGSRLVFAEGHPGGDRLGRPDDLPAALCAVEQAMKDYGIPLPEGRARSRWRAEDHAVDFLPGFAGVRRCDATVDLSFGSSSEGLAVLAGVAALQLPRMKSATWREQHGRIETVAMYGHNGKKMLARWYDKGIESGRAPRGHLIRPEDQRRYSGQTRRDVDELTTAYVREKFQSRFLPLWRATKGITVGSPLVLAEKLAELQAEEIISHRVAESLAGFLLLDQADAYLGPARTRRRRRSQARQHGLVLADGVMQEVEVDLHEVLEQALDAGVWDG